MSGHSAPCLRFDEFRLDPQRRVLTRKGQELDLSPRLVDILGCLAAHPGELVLKETLLNLYWCGREVNENTLAHAVMEIRKALGDDCGQPRYIQTVARKGYRFVGAVVVESASGSPQLLQDFARGRAALETLDATRLPEAVAAFERAVAARPQYAPAHIGLANAKLLQYEGTRAWNTPRRDWLDDAVVHARRGSELAPGAGEAWGTLGFVLTAAGEDEEARAAAKHATEIEPGIWRHHVRFSIAAWGDERLSACRRVLAFLRDFAPARYAAAMVHVARQAFAFALDEAEAGATAQSHEQSPAARFPAIGLHWLRGLLLLHDGQTAAALASFARELADLRVQQIYAEEFRVNAEIAAGFAHLSSGAADLAAAAFRRALAVHPRNGRALIGLRHALCQQHLTADAQHIATEIETAIEELTAAGRAGEAALITAAAQTARGDVDGACATLADLLNDAPPGHVGWLIPIDPAFAALRTHPRYPALLRSLSARAT